MDIQEAIDLISEDIADAILNDKGHDAYVLAVKALQEQAEREKGCPYCDPKNVDYYYAGNVPNYCKHCGRKLK